jgi:hypothetical protein
MSRLRRLCVTLGSIVLVIGCSSANTSRYVGPYSARWVRQQIKLYERPTNEASSVTGKRTYAGGPAYLIPSPCCDKYDYLYDSRGVILCAPSGGFTGRGDGSCPDVSRPTRKIDRSEANPTGGIE